MIYLWLSLIVVFFALEAVTMDLFGIWFTAGAFAAFLTSYVTENIAIQTLVFIVVSVILLLFTRPAVKKYFTPRRVRTNLDRIVGEHAIVLKTIKPFEVGEVKVDGKIWSAIAMENQEIAQGETVTIVSIEGAKVIVK
jgi:membrane protein implicated in regulation of membrane protease activity